MRCLPPVRPISANYRRGRFFHLSPSLTQPRREISPQFLARIMISADGGGRDDDGDEFLLSLSSSSLTSFGPPQPPQPPRRRIQRG